MDSFVLESPSVAELFNVLLFEASKENKFKISDQTHAYLVSVLESYVATPEGLSKKDMLSEQLLKALQEEEEHLRRSKLKKLGEGTLFKTGFFGSSLKRKLVGLNFYIQVGEMAFSSLYQITTQSLYEDLSKRFMGYVDLFDTLGGKLCFENSKMDLLYLFDRYMEGGSEVASKQLRVQGVNVGQFKKGLKQ